MLTATHTETALTTSEKTIDQQSGNSENHSKKTRYSDQELEEFRGIILQKLDKARKDYEVLKSSLDHSDSNDILDTSPTFKVLEEGATTLSKEEAGQLAQRQEKFIQHLQSALVRIKNKTYGICEETGKLIPKERLKAVPHTRHSINGKEIEKNKKKTGTFIGNTGMNYGKFQR